MLGDHPAHARADDVRLLDAQRIEQAGPVIGHIGQRIGHFGLQPELGEERHLDQPRRLDPIELVAEADIAIVVADDAETAAGKRLDQFVGPQRQLCAEPHDQQHGRGGLVALFLVVNLDPVRDCLGHCSTSSEFRLETSSHAHALVQRKPACSCGFHRRITMACAYNPTAPTAGISPRGWHG